jgi:ATP-dependent helicase/nuclease subunit A
MIDAQTPQRIAADPAFNVFVTANAGSGKTKTLIDRVARLLLKRTPPERILCVTYTKAAAAEMQRRLFQVLGGWSVMEDAKLSETLTDLVGEAPDGLDLSQARRLFAQALETPGGLKIQTIHAFCEQLLKRFPLEAGVSPRFSVMDDAEASLIAAEARADVATLALGGHAGVQAAYSRLSIALDHQSFEQMFSDIEMRRFAIARYVEAVGDDLEGAVWYACGFDEGPSSSEAVELEASKDFDRETWRAAMGLLSQGGKTDQKNAGLIAAALEAGPTPSVMTLCAIVCTEKGDGTPATWVEKSAALKARPDIHEAMLKAQSGLCQARERLRAVTVALDSLAVLRLAVAYAGAYVARKDARGAMDFADLIDKALKLVKERPDAAWVLYKLDGGIDHILVDEAQDTAPEQWELVERLTDPFFSGEGAAEARDLPLARSLFVVGDVKQSIFSFQGADASRVLEESRAYDRKARDAGLQFRSPALIHSWRSTPQVLRVVDTVFIPEGTRRGVPPPEDSDVVSHIATRADHPGSVELWPIVQDEKVEPRGAWDAPVDQAVEGSSNQTLAAQVADEIQALIARGDAVFDKDRKVWRPAEAGDVLILVRRRGVLFNDLLRALKRRNIPVAGADRLRLSEHILFDDLMAIGRVLLFPEDDLTLAALLKSPFFDLKDDDLFELGWRRKGRSLWGQLRLRADERPHWRTSCDRLDRLARAARTCAPYELYARFLSSVDGEGRSMRTRAATRLGGEAADVLDAFLAEVLACEARGAGDLQTTVDLMGRSDIVIKREMDAPRGEVRVMSVHGAKGLEAPILFLPETTAKGLGGRGSPLLVTEEGGFLWAGSSKLDCDASQRAREAREERESDEALRLLYVALTRARDRLIVCGRLDARSKIENVEGWYGAVRNAFAHPDLADAVRPLEDGRQRYGDDPVVLGAADRRVVEVSPPPAWLARAAPAEHGRGWASPSALVARPAVSAVGPLNRKAGLGRFRRGELIHKLFELLPDLAPNGWAASAAAFLRRQPDLDEGQREEIASAVLRVLQDDRFAELFGPGSRAEAAVVGWGPGLPEGLRIAGRLDRLVVTSERVLVCDYKTNRPAPRAVEETDPAHVAQLAAYVAVLRGLWPGRPVRAAMLWTDGPRLDLIPEPMIDAALAALAP